MSRLRLALVFENKDRLADFMVRKWRELSEEAIDRKGHFCAALSGGETPYDFYSRLVEIRGEIQWDRIHIFLADERFVPVTDKDSNYRMIKETLLDLVDIPPENVHPVPVAEADPERSARAYEKEMIRFFSLVHDELPEFDLVMLGLGTDGHTASLFPGSKVLDESRRMAAAVYLDAQRHHRITLTLPVINNAKDIFFMMSGKKKAEITREVVENSNLSLPASRVRPEKGDLLFLCDAGAGELLAEHIVKRV